MKIISKKPSKVKFYLKTSLFEKIKYHVSKKGDKVFWFLFRLFFPKTMKELVQLKKDYQASQNAIREKQNDLQKIERRIRKLERGRG